MSLTNKVDNFILNLSKKTLSLEIKITCNSISKTQKYIHNNKENLKIIIPNEIFNEYNNRLKRNDNIILNKIKNSNISKFNRLNELKSDKKVLFFDNAKWFKNISDTDIPSEISDFLSLGPKFSVS